MKRAGPVAVVLAASVVLGGACAPTPLTSSGRVSIVPTAAEARMIDDLVHHREGATSSLQAALIVGGPADPGEMVARARALDATLAEIATTLPLPPMARGRALLEALYDRGLLRTYDAKASTLYDVVTTGDYNCVSSSTLYILGAARAGLDARPVLLPSHARVDVVLDGRHVVVETTTRNGFNAPPSVSREALERGRPKGPRKAVDLYTDEQGTEVDWNALLAVTYGNLGIAAQAAGDTALATSLLAREAALTPPAQAVIVRTQQVSLLSELATRALGQRHFDEALALARNAADAAPDASSRRLTEQNIDAIASQKLVAVEPQLSDAALAAFAEPFRAHPSAYGDIQALVLTLEGSRRLRRGDVNGSAAALRQAAGLATSAEVRGQAGHNARLGEINRISTLSSTDPERAWAEWQQVGPRDPALLSVEGEAEALITENRAIRFSNDGACDRLEGVLSASASVHRPDGLRASCHARRALADSEHGDFQAAITEMHLAVRFDPGEGQHKKNLVVMLEKEIDRLVHASRCKDAAPLIAEGRALDPSAPFLGEVVAFCAAR